MRIMWPKQKLADGTQNIYIFNHGMRHKLLRRRRPIMRWDNDVKKTVDLDRYDLRSIDRIGGKWERSTLNLGHECWIELKSECWILFKHEFFKCSKRECAALIFIYVEQKGNQEVSHVGYYHHTIHVCVCVGWGDKILCSISLDSVITVQVHETVMDAVCLIWGTLTRIAHHWRVPFGINTSSLTKPNALVKWIYKIKLRFR